MLNRPNDWTALKAKLTPRVLAGRLPAIAVSTAIAALAIAIGLQSPWPLLILLALGVGLALRPVFDRAEVTTQFRQSLTPAHAPSRHDPAATWRQVMDAMADPALMLGRDQTIIAANASAQIMFPACNERSLTQVHRDPQLLSAVDQAYFTRQTQVCDMHMLLPVERHLSVVATPMSGQGQAASAPAVLLLFRDRTEADNLAQMRAEFVANASHELRTPLAALKGFVETLQGAARNDPAARDKFLAIMQDQAQRMSRLIEDLLSLSRIEMRQHVPPTGVVDLAELIAQARQALQQLAAEAGVTIDEPTLSATTAVIGDRDELMQVVQNLMQNAIKYGRRSGRVRICFVSEEARVALMIADDGIGIAAQHLPRLTERFYRVSTKESRERGGTGLGLAIVKHIVNRHRGELRIQSTLGKGSTFTVVLPAA